MHTNLTFLLGGKSVNLPTDSNVRKALAYFGADHYVRARQTGYVLYVEGRTDIEILKALARKLNHPVYDLLDGRINSYYVQSNYPQASFEARLEGVEGGYGLPAREHYFTLRSMLPQLKGLAVFDSDGQNRADKESQDYSETYWSRYEIENYIVTPETLTACAEAGEADAPLFAPDKSQIERVLDDLVLEQVFDGVDADFQVWKRLDPDGSRLLWANATRTQKLSGFAEEFFRRLGAHLGRPMLHRKGDLHRLVEHLDPALIPPEVNDKLDGIAELIGFAHGEGD